MGERLVLAMDGSTRACSAALLRRAEAGGSVAWEVAARRVEIDSKGQARVLLRLVDDMLTELGGGPKDMGAIVVGVGPGTFTGVRIAVAAARGLALSLAVPVLGVSTLSALAAAAAVRVAGGAAPPWTRLVPVVDARRQQVFYGVYEASPADSHETASTWVRRGEFAACDASSFDRLVGARDGERTLVVGAERALVGGLPEGVEFLEAEVEAEHLIMGQRLLKSPGEVGGGETGEWLLEVFTRASFAFAAGAENGVRAGSGAPVEGLGAPETVRPIYVRSPDADVHITKMKDPWGDGRVGP